jgi:hypothetical protein
VEIQKCVDDPALTDPDFLALKVARALLPFYKARARPGPYEPTPSDLQEQILVSLENETMWVETWPQERKGLFRRIRCMTILKAVDDWYGSKG